MNDFENADQPDFTCASSRTIYHSPFLSLREDKVEVNGILDPIGYAIVERADYVIVIAIKNNHILVTRQYRYPIQRWTLELPQGAIEPGESSANAASRELFEETGQNASQLLKIGTLYEAAAFATHAGIVYQAEIHSENPMASTSSSRDIMEAGMSSHWLNLSEISSGSETSNFQDGPSLAAIALYLLRQPNQSTL